jgi:hypothetical protein
VKERKPLVEVFLRGYTWHTLVSLNAAPCSLSAIQVIITKILFFVQYKSDPPPLATPLFVEEAMD